MPSSADPEVLANWLATRRKHVVKAGERELAFDPADPGFVKDLSDKTEFVICGHVAGQYLKSTHSKYGQWGLSLTKPGIDCLYMEGIAALKAKLEAVGGGRVTVDLSARGGRNGIDLRFARRHSDFPENEDAGGSLNSAPQLDDVSVISSNSIVAVAFTVKLWDQKRFDMTNAESATPTRPSTSTIVKARGGKAAERKGKAKDDNEPIALAARLELVTVWYLGVDSNFEGNGGGDRSPTKIARLD
ncbi:hypothetical protein Rhopal_004935-T1 [Rhodotorula paludigena]|uniref:Uncharacterized protein n=1 Tax=Rhodotorula paludigena TaxID=86838 RepID=A0AAV5GH47_9BASI|nr:hypothetical protein Rhopal_004935-T1 [Rhodotorula paludigena]